MDKSNLLMLRGVAVTCVDCGDERIFVPTDESDAAAGAFCCTGCDAAVFLIDPAVDPVLPAPGRRADRVA
jgi:hypothetical protein